MRPLIVLLFSFLPFFAIGLPSISQFIKQAEVIKVNAVNSVTSTSIKVSTMVRGFAANDPYQVKTLEVPKANFMSHIRGSAGGGIGGLVKRNAWYAGWFATMAAAGWAIDELHNQVTRTVAGEQTGSCVLNNSLLGSGVTLPSCLGLVAGKGNYVLNFQAVDNTPYPPVLNRQTNFKAYVCPNGWTNTYCYYAYPYFLPGTQQPDTVQPVTDDALFDSLANEMMKDPQKAADAFMVPDAYPYPYPNIFPSSVPYIPGVSEADQDALDLYYKGLLQSTNPNAANYVTPERYQQIAALATKLQQGQTPQGQADALNDDLKKPLTQKQLEDMLKKQQEEQAQADAQAAQAAQQALAPAATALDKMAEEKTWLENQIRDSTNQSPPSQGLSLPKWVWPVGQCRPIPITFSISHMSAKANDGGAFCENYNNVYHPLLYWFLYMLLALYLFVLWNKTMLQVVGSR